MNSKYADSCNKRPKAGREPSSPSGGRRGATGMNSRACRESTVRFRRVGASPQAGVQETIAFAVANVGRASKQDLSISRGEPDSPNRLTATSKACCEIPLRVRMVSVMALMAMLSSQAGTTARSQLEKLQRTYRADCEHPPFIAEYSPAFRRVAAAHSSRAEPCATGPRRVPRPMRKIPARVVFTGFPLRRSGARDGIRTCRQPRSWYRRPRTLCYFRRALA
jgi:hypothetical protein